jgi:XTP/dITP diphosphohydrolase
MPERPRTLVLATRNQHKLREFRRILEPYGLRVEPLPEQVELPPETGETFEANAVPKARTAARVLARAAIADDSGIEAEALGGAPGVRSARFAGEQATDRQNLEKLLREAPDGSPLRYVCVLAYAAPGADGSAERTFFGECRGHLTTQARGTGGFGYDPAFVPEDHGERTMAELPEAEKDAISHRGHAIRAFADWYLA